MPHIWGSSELQVRCNLSAAMRAAGKHLVSETRVLQRSGLRRATDHLPAERNFSIAATPSRPLAPSTLFGTICF
jgi:hypothetical protein